MRLLLLGHRGARNYAAENTIAAFDLAVEHGCDGIEFDVRLTSDARAVICHDPKYHGRVVAQSPLECLVDAGSTLTLLREVACLFQSRAFLYIELKVPGAESAVVHILRDYPPERGYVVASFLPEVVERMRELDTGIPLGLICGNSRELSRWPALRVDYVMPKHSLVSRKLVEELHSANKRVLVWTVNTASEMRELAGMSVDGILSDDTLLLCRTLGGG